MKTSLNVLITGGTGFIGSRLALRCLEEGHSVRVLGQENNAAESETSAMLAGSGAEVLLVSITDQQKVAEALQGVDVVYHLAAAQHEANIPDSRFWEVNVNGTRNILEASVTAGVKRLVYGSTIGVYGSAPNGTLDEDSPLRPDNIYGVTKLEAEKLALSFAAQLPVVAIRISETYGPGDRRLLKLFKAIKKNRFFVIGKGTNLHHPIFIDDLIRGLIHAAANQAINGKVLILSGKEPVTTNQMASTIAAEVGGKVPRWHAPLLPFLSLAVAMAKTMGPLGMQPPLHPRRMDFFRTSFIFSGVQAAQALEFTPQIGFKEGVRQTASWYTEMGYL